MMRQKGMAGIVVLAIIVGSLAVGLLFKYTITDIDHPLEQVTEHVLSGHGIDIDFSKSKKERLFERYNGK